MKTLMDVLCIHDQYKNACTSPSIPDRVPIAPQQKESPRANVVRTVTPQRGRASTPTRTRTLNRMNTSPLTTSVTLAHVVCARVVERRHKGCTGARVLHTCARTHTNTGGIINWRATSRNGRAWGRCAWNSQLVGPLPPPPQQHL